MNKQRGVTLSGLLFAAIVIIIIGAAALKVMPDVLEYLTVLKDMKAVAQDPSLRDASASEVRKYFDRRLQMDYITGISGSDLDISREGSNLVLKIAYSRRIPLVSNVALVIDFEGSSAK